VIWCLTLRFACNSSVTKYVVHILLSIFLLAAQALLLAHGLEHVGEGHHDTVCEQCITTSNVEHPAALGLHALAAPGAFPEETSPAPFSSRTRTSAYFPRGPPLSTHP